jgi:hypothetical protein
MVQAKYSTVSAALIALVCLLLASGKVEAKTDCCDDEKLPVKQQNLGSAPSYLAENASSNQSKTVLRPLVAPNERGLKPLAVPITVIGEVVDTWCYAGQIVGSGRGEYHKPCALACAHGGVTLGIVDDKGTLYVAAKTRAYTGCKELLIPFMAKRVKATGWLATKGGSNIMKIQKVELVK